MKRIHTPFTASATVSGRVKCLVVDAKSKKTIKEYPWQNNLILNHCFNHQYTVEGINFFSLSQMMLNACAGNGTTPTRDDSGATTAQQVGNDVTLSGGSFVFTNTATDAGKVIKWDSGEEAIIVTVVSPTEVTVLESQSVSAEEFTVFRTNQTILANEIARTSTKVDGSNGSSFPNPNQQRSYRTFEFAEEVGSVTYTEVGFRNLTTLNGALSVRVLLAVPVSLIAGQQLRLVYQWDYIWSPAAKLVDVDDLIVGWPQYPVASQMCEWGIERLLIYGVSSSGGVDTVTDSSFEPRQFRINGTARGVTANVTPVRDVPSQTQTPNYHTTIIGGNPVRSMSAYVNNSFEIVGTYTFSPAWGSTTNFGSFVLGNSDSLVYFSGLRLRFYVQQSKLDTHRLKFNIRLKMGRVLT